MKMVRFTESMAPHNVGETRVVPDDVALRLVEVEKVATYEDSVFDDVKGEPGAAAKPAPARRERGKFFTKKSA